jgi:hypothetical protein
MRPSRPILSILLFAFVAVHAPVCLAQITNVTNDQATPIPGVGHDYIKMLNETVSPGGWPRLSA